jgi:NADPH-dependent 2,4-dienoyl-CoA reductase/sulfur reductase-like enzyme
MTEHDIIIIGAGPAGLAAAIAAKEAGVDDVVVIERDAVAGGILNQCIHNGFGLHTFHEELTGPEYAARFLRRAEALHTDIRLSTMVLSLTRDRVLTVTSRERGMEQMKGRAVILAMGCRERPRGALNIPGYRPAGIYSAGTAQRLVNLEGYLPGREVVILGSGDIGLIMARRMTLEGAKVKCVAELLPYSGGLKRNIVQCLHDYDIPLLLSHTVVDIRGKERLEGVTLAEVGADRKPVAGTEQYIPCDTLLLSVGLLPENELSEGAEVTLDRVTGGPEVNESLETTVPGIFACGNVLHVHDLVDFVSEEATRAGAAAAAYVRKAVPESGRVVKLTGRNGVRYTVPQTVRPDAMGESVTVRFRVANPFYGKYLSCYVDGERIAHRKKQIMAPGEMEQFTLTRESLGADAREVVFCVEEE